MLFDKVSCESRRFPKKNFGEDVDLRILVKENGVDVGIPDWVKRCVCVFLLLK
jgi:hypothetical protein